MSSSAPQRNHTALKKPGRAAPRRGSTGDKIALFVAIVACVVGCAKEDGKPTKGDLEDATRSSEQPVIALWYNGGLSEIHAKQQQHVIFAAWPDGMVVFRADSKGAQHLKFATASEVRDHKLMVGWVPSAKVEELQRTADQVGVFNPPIEGGVSYPDGPLQTLCVRWKTRYQRLFYHGRDDWYQEEMARIGPHAVPSREQFERYARIWTKMLDALSGITPAKVTPFTGEQKIELSQTQ